MQKDMRKSEQFNKCSDLNETPYRFSLKEKTKRVNRSIVPCQIRYVTWISYQKIQKVRKTKLPLRRRTSPYQLLSFGQCTKSKTNYDLCFFELQSHGRESSFQLSRSAKDYGRIERYQSRIIKTKATFIKKQVWHQKWNTPP